MITTVPTVLCCCRSGGTAGRVIRVSPGQLASAVHCQAAVTTASQRGAGYPLPLPTPAQNHRWASLLCTELMDARDLPVGVGVIIGLSNLPNSNNIRHIGLKNRKTRVVSQLYPSFLFRNRYESRQKEQARKRANTSKVRGPGVTGNYLAIDVIIEANVV